jgi:hypothetical protein
VIKIMIEWRSNTQVQVNEKEGRMGNGKRIAKKKTIKMQKNESRMQKGGCGQLWRKQKKQDREAIMAEVCLSSQGNQSGEGP